MLIPDVSAQQLDNYIKNQSIVFVDFWAQWCAPCKQFGVIFAEVANDYPDLTFAQINIEQESTLVDIFEIRSVPYLIVFKQGVMIYAHSGTMPRSALRELIEKTIAIEVDTIKASIEEKNA